LDEVVQDRLRPLDLLGEVEQIALGPDIVGISLVQGRDHVVAAGQAKQEVRLPSSR